MSQSAIEAQRLLLQEILEGVDGVKKVYFQPPKNIMLEYPCIIYSINRLDSHYSNNTRYLSIPTYDLTLVDYSIDSDIPELILSISNGCHATFDRYYASDNLHHWSFTLTFSKALW